jgi:hypothetical protein
MFQELLFFNLHFVESDASREIIFAPDVRMAKVRNRASLALWTERSFDSGKLSPNHPSVSLAFP